MARSNSHQRNNLIRFALLALILWAGAQPSFAAPILAWDITGGSTISLLGTPRANGAQFSVSQSTDVTALGMFDHGADGLRNDHLVSLWTDVGALLAQTTVTNASSTSASADANGQWFFESIATLTLAPGTYRVAVGYGVSGDDEVRFGDTMVTNIGATYIMEAFTPALGGVSSFPSQLTNNPLFAANMLVEGTETPIPEPATLALLGLGLVGVRAARRRRT